MTNTIRGVKILFERDLVPDAAQPIVNALRMVKGVQELISLPSSSHEPDQDEKLSLREEAVNVAKKGNCIRYHEDGALITFAVGKHFADQIQKAFELLKNLSHDGNPNAHEASPNEILVRWIHASFAKDLAKLQIHARGGVISRRNRRPDADTLGNR